MMQASLETCYEFATGVHIVGSGICALLEMHAETVRNGHLRYSLNASLYSIRLVASSPKERRHMTHIFSEKEGKQHALGVLAPSPRDP